MNVSGFGYLTVMNVSGFGYFILLFCQRSKPRKQIVKVCPTPPTFLSPVQSLNKATALHRIKRTLIDKLAQWPLRGARKGLIKAAQHFLNCSSIHTRVTRGRRTEITGRLHQRISILNLRVLGKDSHTFLLLIFHRMNTGSIPFEETLHCSPVLP